MPSAPAWMLYDDELHQLAEELRDAEFARLDALDELAAADKRMEAELDEDIDEDDEDEDDDDDDIDSEFYDEDEMDDDWSEIDEEDEDDSDVVIDD